MFIESEGTTDIDEILDQLINKHKEFIEPLKDTGFVPKGPESIIYNFTEIIAMNTFVKTLEWLTPKRCVLNP